LIKSQTLNCGEICSKKFLAPQTKMLTFE